jgi:hypothetical protein
MRSVHSPRLRALLVLGSLSLAMTACGGGGSPRAATVRDMDGDGILDFQDNDLDGDGLINRFDGDVDGDGVPNRGDFDSDEDGVPDFQDDTPFGPWLPAAQTLFVSSGMATVSFGDVPAGQRAGPAEITIQNDTLDPVTIERVALVGSGQGAYSIDLGGLPGRPFALGAGGTEAFHASFSPASGAPALGRVEVDVRIGTGLFTGVVHLLGQGTAPSLTTSGNPSTIHFGDVPIGVSAGPAVARIENDSQQGYMLEGVDLVGSGGGRFALDLAPLGGGTFPMALGADVVLEFHVTFTPVQGVASVGEVRVRLSGPSGPSVLTLDLLGQGLAPAMTLRPLTLDFGTRLVGVELGEIDLEVRNEFYATGPLRVSAVTVTDAAGGDFTVVDDPTPFTIAPGGTPVTVRLRFAPGAGHHGARVGTLRIQGDDPLYPIDRIETLTGRGAGWQAPLTALPATLHTSPAPAADEPVWLAGSSRFVLRGAGADGVFAALLTSDDELVVVDADPDGDAATADARVVVRWSGLRLTGAPAGAPLDAGTGRHVIFAGPGVDGALGGADDRLHVLDTVSGALRTLSCPSLGARKSRPVLVAPSTGLVVVATGVGGGLLPSADTLLVYPNLVGDLNAAGPGRTVALGVVVPDLAACVPVPVGTDAVLMPVADASDDPDLTDRALSDGNEGLVQVRALAAGVQVDVRELARALSEVGAEADGELFCRPLALDATTALVATEGATAGLGTDDEVVRLDGVGTAAFGAAAVHAVPSLSGLASRPVRIDASTVVLADAGDDEVYGTADDRLQRLSTSGDMALTAFGPGTALAGGGGAASRPVVHGAGVLVASTGADLSVGTSDDRLLLLDPALAGQSSILGVLPVPGGLFEGDRTTGRSAAGPVLLDVRFVGVLDRGADAQEGTADDVLRIFRDVDRDGRFGAVGDDLTRDGSFTAADAVRLPLPGAHGARTPLVATTSAHLLVIGPGLDGALGSGGDDAPVVWWLREAATLP